MGPIQDARHGQPAVGAYDARGRDGGADVEGSRGGRAAHKELDEIRRGCVERAIRPHSDVLLQTDAAGGEGGPCRPPRGWWWRFRSCRSAAALRNLGGVHEAGRRQAVDREVRGGVDPAAVLQGRDAGVDVVDCGPRAS